MAKPTIRFRPLYLLVFCGVSALANSPKIPSEHDYEKISPAEQKEFEAAAYLLNLRTLGVLEPQGSICAEMESDANGNPVFRFSIQNDRAFDTGSCRFKEKEKVDISDKLLKLTKTTLAFHRDVQGNKDALPINVHGFADGQSFSELSSRASQACPEIKATDKVGGSYNQALARARSNQISNELSRGLQDKVNLSVDGYDSPDIVGTKLADCPTRRQVVVSFGSSVGMKETVIDGQYEPAAIVDNTVQTALNASMSYQILKAYESVKNIKEGCENPEQCKWVQAQAVLNELGIQDTDVACRATTMALVDQVLGRATHSKVGDDMLKLVSQGEAGFNQELQSWMKKYETASSVEKQEMSTCGASAMLHMVVPTSDMFSVQKDPKLRVCPHKSFLTNAPGSSSQVYNAWKQIEQVDLVALKRMKQIVDSDPQKIDKKSHADYEQLKSQIELKKSELKKSYPGINSYKDIIAYEVARNNEVGRRNLSHNCIRPRASTLAVGYSLSKNKDTFFKSFSDQKIGNLNVAYSKDTFSTPYNQNHNHGYGCSACGSGIDFKKNQSIQFKNGVVDDYYHRDLLKDYYGSDGMALLKRKTDHPVSASFLSPSTYEIKDCPNCECVKNNMSDALTRAFQRGPVSRSVDIDVKKGATENVSISKSDVTSSCFFSPAVAQACPVGPSGQAEQSKKGAELQRTLTFLDKTMKPVVVSTAGDLTAILARVSSACGTCDVGKDQRKVQDYQALIDELVCSKQKPPVVLPTSARQSSKEDCEAAAKTRSEI